jgi:site-specific DNA-methyltransferase (adenine-specific)
MSDIVWTNTRVKLGDLKPWQDNPRTSTKAQAKRILKSFEQFGQAALICVDPDGSVLDGHQRLSALLTIHGAGYEVEARQSSRPLTDDERRGLVLALANATGSWNWDSLSNWDTSTLSDWGFDKDTLKGWKSDVTALGEFLKSEQAGGAAAEPQTDITQALLEKWNVSVGQLWIADGHRVLCGDSTNPSDIERVMNGERALVFSDAPYGVDIVKNNKVGGGNLAAVGHYAPIVGDETTETAERFYQACLDYGFDDFILWGGNYFTNFLPPSPCWLVWDKRGEMNSNNFADCELAWTSFDKPARVYKQVWAGMIREGEHEKRVHPTQKPVMTTQRIMVDFPADIYFDGFLGSGTTMVSAHNLGKRAFGIELSPAYVAATLERLSNLGLQPILSDLDIHQEIV